MRCWLRLLWCSWSCHHTLCPSLYCILKALIVTIPLFQHSCSHELYQDLQFFYHMCSHYLFARANNDLFPVCHIQVHLSGKLHLRGDATSEPYKPAFHSGHLSHNTFHGGAATFRVFRLPWQRYSYSTQSSMTELLLSVSQHWNLCSGQ